MRKLLLVVLVAGCWTSSKKEETKPVAKQQTPEEARAEAIAQARAAGILGSATLTQGGTFTSLSADDSASSGFDDSNVYGGLLDNDPANGGYGSTAAGGTGTGGASGGGAVGIGTIGSGRYGTIGHGSGTGSGYGVGGRPSSQGPTMTFGTVNVTGDLDKAIVRRYLRRQFAPFQYCYEKTLLAEPSLSGVLAMQFVIDTNGKVTSTSASGVHADVATCIRARIETIQFPKPKSGGVVQVTTTLTFKPHP